MERNMETSDRIIFGVATLPSRNKFFRTKVLPNMYKQADEVWVYRDDPCFPGPDLYRHTKMGGRVEQVRLHTYGDAGKFLGFVHTKGSKGIDGESMNPESSFYYFSCDDDLIYPPDYASRMIEWIEYFDRKVVVALHGASFYWTPVSSFYKQKQTLPCLATVPELRRVQFPGTGVLAFHSSLLDFTMDEFKVPNMADVWMGKILQERKIPAVVIPHTQDYLTYNWDLPLEDTIWAWESPQDFLQTAIVNQLALSLGQLRFFPLELEREDRAYPGILSPSPELRPRSLSPLPTEQLGESDTSEGAS